MEGLVKFFGAVGFCLITMPARAEPATYYCTIFTALPGAQESAVFRFDVGNSQAVLSYSIRLKPEEEPRSFEVLLDILNDSDRSLVLGSLTEGSEVVSPRYDVWVLDKKNMQLSSEQTLATDAGRSRLQSRSGNCVVGRVDDGPR